MSLSSSYLLKGGQGSFDFFRHSGINVVIRKAVPRNTLCIKGQNRVLSSPLKLAPEVHGENV